VDAERMSVEMAVQCDLLRDIFANPFRALPAIDRAWLGWRRGVVRELARVAYEERRLPEGTLDPARLSVLADALEDAGCTDPELLGHLRGPGPHVRGCWAVDLVLGKSLGHVRRPFPLRRENSVALTFALCPECLAKYRALRHNPACQYWLNIEPSCTLEWPDERPKDFYVRHDARHRQCALCILRLVDARTHLWQEGVLPEDLCELWDEARQAIPDWPGFRRLSLDAAQIRSLDACAEELEDLARGPQRTIENFLRRAKRQWQRWFS
jgi:hypothetical protein